MCKKIMYMLFVVVVILAFNSGINIYAAKTNSNISSVINQRSATKCKHKVYSDNAPATYHYSYCSICKKCNRKTRHTVSKIVNYGNDSYHLAYCSCGKSLGLKSHSFISYTRYNETSHKAKCKCGYVGIRGHNGSPVRINKGDTVLGITYSSQDDLDTYHKLVCTSCGEYTGVEKHNWSGGSTSPHTCSSCSYVHSKKDSATKGLHYFDIDKIRIAGDVAPCVICGEYLKLSYTSDSKLPKLPKKEEYTMVGNPNPMKEETIFKDETIKCNFMPINENGELITIDNNCLKVRAYTNGNYYSHYSKLIGKELKRISERVGYMDDATMEQITNKLCEFGALGGYNDAAKEQVVNELKNQINADPNLNFINAYQVSTVVSQLGDFAIGAIDSPLIDWFSRDSTIKSTWLSGATYTLRQEFFGSVSDASNRKFVIYFTDLSDGKYEILMSPVLTHGITFNILGYSLGGYGQLLFSTLFNIGGSGVGKEAPSNIKAYIAVAYRDTNGNVILNKDGRLATPIDSIMSKTVYSGTSKKNVTTNITAEMNWTQVAGYRYKGYLVKYGTGSRRQL